MIHMINTPPWVDSIRRNFDFIAKHLLPRVNAEDDGKILSVVDGKWTPSEGGGGGGALVCEINFDAGTGDLVLDKTAGEIIKALQKKQIVASLSDAYDLHGTISSGVLLSVSVDSGSGVISLSFFVLLVDGTTDTLTFSAATEDDYPVNSP